MVACRMVLHSPQVGSDVKIVTQRLVDKALSYGQDGNARVPIEAID